MTIKSYRSPLVFLALAFVGVVASVSAFSPAYASASTTVLTTQMDVGAQGPQVIVLQTYLATNSSIYPEGLVTGYYGSLTEAAVARFQSAHGLSPVGRVGPQTLALINPLIANSASLDMTAPSISNLHTTRAATGFTVSWNTNEPTFGSIHYSLLPITQWETTYTHEEPQTSGTLLSDVALGTAHTLSVTGLNPNDTYYVSTESKDAAGNVSVTLSTPILVQ